MRKRRLVLGLLSLAVVGLTLIIVQASPASTPRAIAQETNVTLTTEALPVGCATTTAQLSGDTSTVSPGSEWTFPDNSYVKVTAIVAESCTFSHWELDYGGGTTFDFHENPARFLITEGMTATAHLTVPEVCTQTTLGQGSAQVPALAKDCNILMAAKDALRGTGTLNWSAATAITGWDGITVSGTPSRVTGLDLSLHGLTGRVPATLGALSALGSLDLSWNKLTGSIPATLGHLGELSSLSLSRTSLGGSIPPELGDLAKLEHLSLSQSFLDGAIPAELGKLTNLDGLYLYQNRLTGSIPPELAKLSSLERLFLGQNTFMGCLPRALRRVANNDLDTLGLESCELPSVTLSYDTYDTTGAVATAGSYAFLTEGEGSAMTAVTTYEGLRDGSTTSLLIHKSDAHEASQTALYDVLEAGDLFEWRRADDCFVRYAVTEVKPDPTGTVPRKLLGVEWMTFAFTGCSGTIVSGSASGSSTNSKTSSTVGVRWGKLPDLGGPSLAAPVVHGAYQVAPVGWTGAVVPWQGDYSPTFPELTSTTDVSEARNMRHWREPAVPAGWTFAKAEEGGYEIQRRDGYSAWYVTADGEDGFELRGAYVGVGVSGAKEAAWHSGSSLRETRVVAGRPAVVIYSKVSRDFPLTLWVYDPATQVQYTIYGQHSSLRGGNVDAVIAIAESLFEDTPLLSPAARSPRQSLPVGQSDSPKPGFELSVYAGAPEGVREIYSNGWHGPPTGGALDWQNYGIERDTVNLTVETVRFVPANSFAHIAGRVVRVNTKDDLPREECELVEVEVVHITGLGLERKLGTLHYWHTIPGVKVRDHFTLSSLSSVSHPLGAVAASPWIYRKNVPLTEANKYPKVVDVIHDITYSGRAYRLRWLGTRWLEWVSYPRADRDGELCTTIGHHLHQGADGPGVWPNKNTTAYPSKTEPAYDDDGFGFDPGFQGYDRSHLFCADTWVAKILPPSAGPPLASPIEECAAPDNPPVDLTATPGDGTLTLTWTKPEIEAGEDDAVKGYSVRRRETSPTDSAWEKWVHVTCSADECSYDLTGLTNGNEYTVQVRATNDTGGSPPATRRGASPAPPRSLTTRTKVAGAADFGGGGTVKPTSGTYAVGTSVTVMATAAPGYLFGNWEVEVDHQAGSCTSSVVGDLALTATCAVTINSDTTVTALFRALPGMPTGLSVVEAGDSSVTISWADPSDSGITKYQYRLKATPDAEGAAWGEWTDIPSAGSGASGASAAALTRYTIPSLTNDTLYAIQIRAVNAAGPSEPSAEVRATPEAPTTTLTCPDGTTQVPEGRKDMCPKFTCPDGTTWFFVGEGTKDANCPKFMCPDETTWFFVGEGTKDANCPKFTCPDETTWFFVGEGTKDANCPKFTCPDETTWFFVGEGTKDANCPKFTCPDETTWFFVGEGTKDANCPKFTCPDETTWFFVGEGTKDANCPKFTCPDETTWFFVGEGTKDANCPKFTCPDETTWFFVGEGTKDANCPKFTCPDGTTWFFVGEGTKDADCPKVTCGDGETVVFVGEEGMCPTFGWSGTCNIGGATGSGTGLGSLTVAQRAFNDFESSCQKSNVMVSVDTNTFWYARVTCNDGTQFTLGPVSTKAEADRLGAGGGLLCSAHGGSDAISGKTLTRSELREALRVYLESTSAPTSVDDLVPEEEASGQGEGEEAPGNRFSTSVTGGQHSTAVTCESGTEFTLGPEETLSRALDNGLLGLKVCANEDILSGLTLPASGEMTRAQLETAVNAILSALPVPISLDDLSDSTATSSTEAREVTGQASYTTFSSNTYTWSASCASKGGGTLLGGGTETTSSEAVNAAQLWIASCPPDGASGGAYKE